MSGRSFPLLIGTALALVLCVTLLVLGCTLEHPRSYYPMFMLLGHFMTPIPLVLFWPRDAYGGVKMGSSAGTGVFLFSFFASSGIGIPALLAHNKIISWASFGYCIGSTVCAWIAGVLFSVPMDR